MNETDGFPILLSCEQKKRIPDCPRFVPWHLVAPHEAQAERNHGLQSLSKLASRGGLGPEELYAVMHDKRYETMPESVAVDYVKTLVQ